jgi:DNA-binding transcriptional regulator PaaX
MARIKNQELGFKILKIAGKGVLFTAVSILAPMFPYLVLRAYLKKTFNKSYSDEQLRNSVSYLKRKKFIAYKNKKFWLTKLGRKYVESKSMDQIKIKKIPWDGKWRILSFDIPQTQLAERHIFRRKLKNLGFFHFQRSVFVTPYPCEEEIDQITQTLNISEHVHLFVSNRFRSDKDMKKKFNL